MINILSSQRDFYTIKTCIKLHVRICTCLTKRNYNTYATTNSEKLLVLFPKGKTRVTVVSLWIWWGHVVFILRPYHCRLKMFIFSGLLHHNWPSSPYPQMSLNGCHITNWISQWKGDVCIPTLLFSSKVILKDYENYYSSEIYIFVKYFQTVDTWSCKMLKLLYWLHNYIFCN